MITGPSTRAIGMRVPAGMVLAFFLATLVSCGPLRPEKIRLPRLPHLPEWRKSSTPSGGALSPKAARRIIRRSIGAYGGRRSWLKHEGMELQMVWKTYAGARVVEDPALVQIAFGRPTRIRIHFTKIDQVLGLGDQGPWLYIRGKPEHTQNLLARAHFTTRLTAFLLSLPFNLDDPGVVVRGGEPKTWGGTVFDAVTIGFKAGSYPWPDDLVTVWFRRPDGIVDRCFFKATAEGTDLGPPPNYFWVRFADHTPVAGLPLARSWSFIRAESDGTMKEKLFDIVVESAVANRSFMPVLFREPIIEPVVRKLPMVGGGTATPLSPAPTP